MSKKNTLLCNNLYIWHIMIPYHLMFIKKKKKNVFDIDVLYTNS